MKSTVFQLKMFRNDIQNLYIEIEQMGQNNPQQYEMNLKQNNQETMLYTCSIKLDSEQLYRYRYILKNNNYLLKEENFRRFKKDENEDEDEDEQNLVDEWNKVWNNIQVVFDKNEFFAECEKFQIFRNLRPYPNKISENNVFQLKQLSDDYQFYEQQQTQTFTNYQNEQEFQIHKNQEIHLNFVITKITFGQLGKQLVKQLGPNFQYLLEQVENKFQQKDDSIKQLIEQQTQQLCQQMEQLKQKQILAEELELFQKQSLKKFEEHIDQINKLQFEVEKQKEIALSFQFEQLKVKKIDFDFNNNKVDKSQTSDELLELLQKYQNSLDEIDLLRNENDSQLESKEKVNEFLKKKNEKLAKIIQQCENQLKDVEQKLNQYEEELRNVIEQKEKNEQTIKILRQQIIRQKQELQNHKDFSNNIQIQLAESEQQLIQLKNNLDIQIKANEEFENKLKQIIERDQQKSQQTEESLKENLEKLQNQVYQNDKLAHEVDQLRKEIQIKDEEMAQENKKYSKMKQELEDIIEGSKHQKNLDDENFKNQILQNAAYKTKIEDLQQQMIQLNEQLKQEKIKLDEQHNIIENKENQITQLNDEFFELFQQQLQKEKIRFNHLHNVIENQEKSITQLKEKLKQEKDQEQQINLLQQSLKYELSRFDLQNKVIFDLKQEIANLNEQLKQEQLRVSHIQQLHIKSIQEGKFNHEQEIFKNHQLKLEQVKLEELVKSLQNDLSTNEIMKLKIENQAQAQKINHLTKTLAELKSFNQDLSQLEKSFNLQM